MEAEEKVRSTCEKGAKKPGKQEQGSPYLIACDEQERERRKEWLYEILGPVFFGEKEAADAEELKQMFQEKYGIDVQHDFVEGDEHYDEYLEAQQAIAEGMSIYGGEIGFGDSTLAELAEQPFSCRLLPSGKVSLERSAVRGRLRELAAARR